MEYVFLCATCQQVDTTVSTPELSFCACCTCSTFCTHSFNKVVQSSLNKVLLVRKHFKRSFWIAFLVHWPALHAQYQSEKLFISYTNVLWCPQDNKNTSKAVEEKKVVENIKADIQSHWGSHIYVCMCAYIWVFLLLHVSVKRWADEVPVKPAYQTYVNKLATLSSLNFV